MFTRLVALLILGTLAACTSPTPNRDPSGETFPSVTGNSLAGNSIQLPEAFSGEPVILLVGYVQDAQFDLDRWLLGLVQLETPGERREVPTIPGLMPGLAADWIDGGMRRGIPREDWAAVVTVYDDGDMILEMTGNESPRNGRILLLDGDGKVVWFHDRGFSAGKAAELDQAMRELLSTSDV